MASALRRVPALGSGTDLNRTNRDPVAFQNDRTPQAPLRVAVLESELSTLPVNRVVMMSFDVHRVLYAQVPYVPGGRWTGMMMLSLIHI